MSIGVLIFVFVVVGALLGRAGSGLGAVLFLGLSLALFITTPAGDGLPAAVMDFFQGVSDVSGPALGTEQAGAQR